MNRYDFGKDQELHTLTLRADEWKEVARLLERIRSSGDGRPESNRGMLLARARQAFADRRRRIGFFGDTMFGEPAWDMLLILYMDSHAQRHTIASLTRATGAAPSTVLRWLGPLESLDLIVRIENPLDARTVIVALTEKAEKALDTYFSETLTPLR
jgi:DNA-binding MarR family transcriptional regulator